MLYVTLVSYIAIFFCAGEAEANYAKLKARYSRRKTELRKAKHSGTGRMKALEKAESDLKMYDFLKWLDPFLSSAESISNLDDPIEQDSQTTDSHMYDEESSPEESDEEESDINPDPEDANKENKDQENDSYGENELDNVSEISLGKISKAMKGSCEDDDTNLESVSGGKKKKVNAQPRQPLSKLPDGIPQFKKSKVTSDEILATINKRLHEKKKEKQDKKEAKESVDENDIFGKMVASELRSLPKKMRSKLKHDINNAIFKYQCQLEEEESPRSLLQQPEQQPDQQQQQIDVPHPFQTYRQEMTGPNYTTLQLPGAVLDPRMMSPSGSSTSSFQLPGAVLEPRMMSPSTSSLPALGHPSSPYNAYGLIDRC